MVFRDKKGKTIRDVRQEEIHILEDGVEQNLTSFRLIEGNAAGCNTGGARYNSCRSWRGSAAGDTAGYSGL